MITKDEIKNLAMLSKLCVTEEELSSLTAQLQQMVDFVDTVAVASATEAEPEDNSLSALYREDEVVESLPCEEILKNAPRIAEGHFLVRKRA